MSKELKIAILEAYSAELLINFVFSIIVYVVFSMKITPYYP